MSEQAQNREDNLSIIMQQSKLQLSSTTMEETIMKRIIQQQQNRKRIHKYLVISKLFFIVSLIIGFGFNAILPQINIAQWGIPNKPATLLFQTILVLVFLVFMQQNISTNNKEPGSPKSIFKALFQNRAIKLF